MDNPLLTCRYGYEGSPLIPIILDHKLRIPLDARVLEHALLHGALIFCGPLDNLDKKAKLERFGSVKVIESPLNPKGLIDLNFVLSKCKMEFSMKRIMVEGGISIIESFLEESLFDHLIVTISPRFVPRGRSIKTSFSNLTVISTEIVGRDTWITMKRNKYE